MGYLQSLVNVTVWVMWGVFVMIIYVKREENHFQVMKDMIIFQNSPTKLANSTWYCTGMNQKLMEEAKGQIFQLLIIIYWYLSFKVYIPFFQDWILRSVTIWLMGKKKAIRIGAKTSWSIAIDPNTLTVLETLGKMAAWTLGSSLQYHIWRQGPKYPKPIVKKSRFLFQLN